MFAVTCRRAGFNALGDMLNSLYWVTLVLMRFLVQPALLFWFAMAMSETQQLHGSESGTTGSAQGVWQRIYSQIQALMLYSHHQQCSVQVPRFHVWERVLVLGSQLFLCVFNVGLAMNHVSRKPSRKLSSNNLHQVADAERVDGVGNKADGRYKKLR